MTNEINFTENVLRAFKNVIREIEKGAVEHDIRPRFVKYFVEPVLGYSGSNYRYEKKRTDITIFDENNFAIIKVETKKPSENIEKTEHEEQAFKYEEETTRFIGLTNFLQFKLWEVSRTGKELKINLDFSRILEQKELLGSLTAEEKSQILFLNNLTKDILFDASKYEEFDENYARIDITKEAGFRKLLERLNSIANGPLFGYTLKAFGEYKEGYGKYLAELSSAERGSKSSNGNSELNHSIAKYKQKLEEKYERYKTFSGYSLWKEYSGKEGASDDEIKEIFCKETIYVLLNKLIFIRICEDKGFLEKNISNGGIEQLREFLKRRFDKDVINKEILEMAFKSASGLYSHFYEVGILDWFRTGDGELNDLLNKVLWTLNQFDFAHVDRDILGNLYEKYLPSAERKKLGEFYTPTEVIDYILTSVGYTYSYDIESRDLLDPACGSGGFLVRTSRRLISRYLMKFGKTDKRELRNPKNWKEIVDRLSPDEAKIILEAVQDHIYGLDINPFACHIAEMNLLFQVIDLYQKVRNKHKDYKLKRFRIYRTDSLEKPTQKQIIDYSHAAFLEEQEEIDAIKNKKFDFVVGNPPYVRVHQIDKKDKEAYSKNYKSATGIYDLYVLFIERGINWLTDNAKFGYIVSNKFIHSDYGAGIRKFIPSNIGIEEIIDFGDTGVFKDATNYPLIFIGNKASKKEVLFPFVKVKKPKEQLLLHIRANIKKDDFSDDFLDIIPISPNSLSAEKWEILPKREKEIFNKCRKRSKLLSDISTIRLGIFTALDEAFIVTEDQIKRYSLNRDLLKPLLRGKNVKKWSVNWTKEYILYPYIKEGTEIKPIELSKYPTIKNYIEQFKSKLLHRSFIAKLPIDEKESRWYEYADAGNPEFFEKTKIITPDISTSNNFTLDEKGYFCLKTCYVILPKNDLDVKLLLGILNSNLLEYLFKKTSPYISGGYYRYMKTYLEKLPIKLPGTAEEKKIANQIIKKVDEILELHKSGILDIDTVLEGEEAEKLCNLPKVTFSISEDAKFEKIKAEESKIYLNSQDFIEIKDKKIMDFVEIYLGSNSEKLSKSKDVKNMILNLPVPKSDEVMKDIVKKGGTDSTQIKEKITNLEDEINELVYELYGITKGEEKIVKENL